MNSVRYALPHPTNSLSFRTRYYAALVLAVVLHLAVAAGFLWAIAHVDTNNVCVQCPAPSPVPEPPAVPMAPPDREPPGPALLPVPEAVPTPPTLKATPSEIGTAALNRLHPVPNRAGWWGLMIGLTGQPGLLFLFGTALLMTGLLAWVWARRAMGFHLRSFNG